MNIGQLKEIVEYISTKGLIDSFKIETDGKVSAVDPANVFMSHIEYSGIEISEPLIVDETKPFWAVINRFPDDATVDVGENFIEIKSDIKHAKIPKFDPDMVRKSPKIPDIDFDLSVEVPLKSFREAVKNCVGTIMELYTFQVKDGKLTLTVGEDEYGTICQEVCDVNSDKELSAKFGVAIPEIAQTLKVDPTVYLKSDFPVRFSVETENYTLAYMVAPRVEQ